MRIRKKAAIYTAAGALALGGLTTWTAQAAIPDSDDGEVHFCVSTSGGTWTVKDVKAIDKQAGQNCPSGYQEVVVNQEGVQGPAGPAGPPGPQGEPGEDASSYTLSKEIVEETFTTPAGTTDPVFGGVDPGPLTGEVLECPSGKTAVNGGFKSNPDDPTEPNSGFTYGTPEGADHWHVDWMNGTLQDIDVTAYVICVAK